MLKEHFPEVGIINNPVLVLFVNPSQRDEKYRLVPADKLNSSRSCYVSLGLLRRPSQ